MEKVFHIGGAIGAKTGLGEFVLGLDIDNTTQEKAEKEIVFLQKKHNLSDCFLYKTKKGFKPVFLYDNDLSIEKIREIQKDSQLCDEDYKNNFIESPDVASLMRVNGKYGTQDISFIKEIPGIRKPNFIQQNTARVLKMKITKAIKTPMIDNSVVQVSVDQNTNKITKVSKDSDKIQERKNEIIEKQNIVSTEKKEIKKQINPSDKEMINEADKIFGIESDDNKQEDKDDIVVDNSVKIEKKASDIWPKNELITQIRKEYYTGPLSHIVARLISAHTHGRKMGVYKDEKNFGKLLTKEKQKLGTDIKIEEYRNFEPVFLSNNVNTEFMYKRFQYNIENTGILKNPLNVFRGLAQLDLNNEELVENIKNTKLMNSKRMHELHAYVQDNIYDLIEGYDIPFDFDSEDLNGNDSYIEAKKMKELLDKKNIPYTVEFSGAKGFHILIPTDKIINVVPEYKEFLKNGGHKVIVQKIQEFLNKNEIAFDKGIYNRGVTGYDRPAYSIHQNTGCVVLPLTDSRFDRLDGFNLREMQEIFRADNLMKGKTRIFTQEYIEARKKEGIEVSNKVKKIVSDLKNLDQKLENISPELPEEERKLEEKEIKKEIRNITNQIPSEMPGPFKTIKNHKFAPQVEIKKFVGEDEGYLSWKEMREKGYDEDEYRNILEEYIRPVERELKEIEKIDPKRFAEIMREGKYSSEELGQEEFLIDPVEYVDMSTGYNLDYCRGGSDKEFRKFILSLMEVK